MFGKFSNSNRSMLREAIDRANRLAQEFDQIGAEIVKATQFDINGAIGRFAKSEYSKWVDEVAAERPLEKSLTEQSELQSQYFEKAEDMRFRLITHARDLNFVHFMNLHEKLCANFDLAQIKLIELMELKSAARDRNVVVRRGDFVKNIGLLSDENIVSAFELLSIVMEAFKNVAGNMYSSLLLAFMFEHEASYENKEVEPFTTKFILKTRACKHENTAAYQSFKSFVESVADLDLMKTLREYVATHPQERLLSIELLKQINPLCDQIEAMHREGMDSARQAVDQIEKARASDVRYFMKKQITPPNVRELFNKNGLAGMMSDKGAVTKLFKLARTDKQLRIALAKEIQKDTVENDALLLNSILQDSHLAPLFQQLSRKNRNLTQLIESHNQALNESPNPRSK